MRVRPIKGRPADHPLIVYLAGAAQAGEWVAEFPEAALCLMARFWPGPLTLVLAGARRCAARSHWRSGQRGATRAQPPPDICPVARIRRWSDCAIGESFRCCESHRCVACAGLARRCVGSDAHGGSCRYGLESTVVPCSTNARRCCAPARCRCLPAIPVRTLSRFPWTSLSGTARAVP